MQEPYINEIYDNVAIIIKKAAKETLGVKRVPYVGITKLKNWLPDEESYQKLLNTKLEDGYQEYKIKRQQTRKKSYKGKETHGTVNVERKIYEENNVVSHK